MRSEPPEEAKWLQQLVGEWTYEATAPAEPGQFPARWKESERVRSLRGFRIVGDGRGEIPGGGTMEALLTIGYDPDKKRFVGTWGGSGMTQLLVYDGELDESEKALTLSCEGPSMAAPGATAHYQDVTAVVDADTRTLTSRMLGDDSAWDTFMTAEFHRIA